MTLFNDSYEVLGGSVSWHEWSSEDGFLLLDLYAGMIRKTLFHISSGSYSAAALAVSADLAHKRSWPSPLLRLRYRGP